MKITIKVQSGLAHRIVFPVRKDEIPSDVLKPLMDQGVILGEINALDRQIPCVATTFNTDGSVAYFASVVADPECPLDGKDMYFPEWVSSMIVRFNEDTSETKSGEFFALPTAEQIASLLARLTVHEEGMKTFPRRTLLRIYPKETYVAGSVLVLIAALERDKLELHLREIPFDRVSFHHEDWNILLAKPIAQSWVTLLSKDESQMN